jgi:hypothetical protein
VTVIRRAHGRTARRLAVLALTAPLAAALVLTTTAGPAAASSVSWTSPTPSNGDVFSSGSSVQLKATLSVSAGESASATLKLTPPSGSAYSYGPWSCRGGTFSGAKCDSQMSAVSFNSASRPNGAWTATINGGFARTFYTNFKPTADPTNLAAAPVGRTEVDLSWSYSGSEPDRAGFEIVETHNGSSRSIFAPAGSCSGSTCGYALTYSEPGVDKTESYSYSVTALRSSGGCNSCGDYTRSGTASGASAQLVGPPPPPTPTPTPTPTGGTTGGTTSGGTTSGGTTTGSTGGTTTGGTTGGSTGGSTTGGSTGGSTTGGSSTTGSTTGQSAGKPIAIPTLPPVVASRKAFALGFNKFSPALGIPKLPPLPAITAPTVGAGNDTYAPTLPYKGGTTKKTTSVLSSPIAAVTSLDTAQLAKSLAVALLLLLCAAHVRLFISTADED